MKSVYLILLALATLQNVLLSGAFEPIQIMCEINGHLVPAIIDTGAEITIMSESCAKRCRIATDIDSKYAGKAIGIGSSEIIGAVDDLPFRIGPINFQNKVSVLRHSRCDFLIGLDILRRFKCSINLADNVLKLSVRKSVIRIPIISREGEDINRSRFFEVDDISSGLSENDLREKEFDCDVSKYSPHALGLRGISAYGKNGSGIKMHEENEHDDTDNFSDYEDEYDCEEEDEEEYSGMKVSMEGV